MSCHEEERGTYLLPSTTAPRLHKALRDHANTHHQQVREKVYLFHSKAGGTRSVRTYIDALRRASLADPLYAGETIHLTSRFPDEDEVRDAALDILATMLNDARTGRKGIHRPTVAEIESVAPRANNRTKTFDVGSEGSISFHGREVTWGIPQNNHAVEHARETTTAGVFFTFLDGITWTRTSGGYCLYANEYTRELGGGGDSVTNRYGPLGGW